MAVVDPVFETELERRRSAFVYGYQPSDKIIFDPSLRLHQSEDRDLDPITYEVIRSKLWNLNVDHGETVRRTSGSSNVADANDFNATITTETGEGAAFGAYNWFFAGYADLVIRWTLEHRSKNPGIEDGDVFLQNDPWVGTNHQNDATVISPIFWEGGLFAWIYNCAHQRDVGGTVPGSTSPFAQSVYEEATSFPPVKLVERGELREDVLDLWTRRSRLPEITSLEVKSQLSGISFARRRLLDIVERYGPERVKRAMNRTIEDSSRIVGQRLSRLPDAVWRDERYIAGVNMTDTTLYKLCVSYEKRGERLRVSNAGTDPAVGMINFSYAGFRGSVVNALFHALAFDLELCGGGLLRQIDFETEPGTISSATYPSAVGSSIGMITSCGQAQLLAAKMVSGDPELAVHGFAPSTIHTLNSVGLSGIDQYGQPYYGSFLDGIAGGGGAFANRDGIDHSGPSVGVSHPIPDVEMVERGLPVLSLYRRELLESGGHGRFRGAPAIVSAWTGQGAPDSALVAIGFVPGVTMGHGVDGALPAGGGSGFFAETSSCREWFCEGRIPATREALRVAAPMEPFSRTVAQLGETSVYELISNATPGYGDPLTRAPSDVVSDLRRGRVSHAEAERVYGVVATDDGYDEAATRGLRARIAEARLANSRDPRAVVLTDQEGSSSRRLLASVCLNVSGDFLACAHCSRPLAPWEGNYRRGCREIEELLSSASPWLEDPSEELGEPYVLRRYLCPGCAVVLDVEMCRPSDPPHQDLQVLHHEHRPTAQIPGS